jgi:ATP-dependent helicase/nuclease subunit A
VLRSPLFGFEDDDLFEIAWNRGASSLRTALGRKVAMRGIFAAAQAFLEKIVEDARSKTPFAFYAEILGAGGGRRRFLARLGPEANDALDEFLNLALEYEQRETPSLQGFLTWVRDARAEVKRDMEIARNEVRVMTVHGAKGLEAPVMILADTTTPPAGPRPPRLLQLADGAMVWAGRKDDDAPAVANARAAALHDTEDEYRRLLYVAMTRAADTLIVCGADSLRARPKGCWYDLIRHALDPLLVEESEIGEKVLRYRKAMPEVAASRETPQPLSQKMLQTDFPPWLRQPAPALPPAPRPLSPSSAFDEDIGRMVRSAASAADRQKSLARGRVVHRLMQSLPDLPPEHRKNAADQYLARAAKDFSADERTQIANEVLAILDDEIFAQIFAAGSRAEVPIVGRLPQQGSDALLVSGVVDRLTVMDDAVLIADYKTDRAVPQTLQEVWPYVAQLALYRAVLSRVYPHKTVRAALIFTNGPVLLEVPGASMDRAIEAEGARDRHAPVKVP